MNTFLLYALAGVLLLLVVAVDTPFLYNVYESGRLAKFRTPSKVKNHVRWGNRFLACMILTVLVIKVLIFLKYGVFFGTPRALSTVNGVIHLWADGLFTVLAVLMKFIFKGTTWPTVHFWFAWTLMLSYLVIVITGGILVKNLLE